MSHRTWSTAKHTRVRKTSQAPRCQESACLHSTPRIPCVPVGDHKFYTSRFYLLFRSKLLIQISLLSNERSVARTLPALTMATPSAAKKDAAAIIASASRHNKISAPPSFKNDNHKVVWCETLWTNLSHQAKRLGLPAVPYFDPETMLLSKDVNRKLWIQLESEKRATKASEGEGWRMYDVE